MNTNRKALFSQIYESIDSEVDDYNETVDTLIRELQDFLRKEKGDKNICLIDANKVIEIVNEAKSGRNIFL